MCRWTKVTRRWREVGAIPDCVSSRLRTPRRQLPQSGAHQFVQGVTGAGLDPQLRDGAGVVGGIQPRTVRAGGQAGQLTTDDDAVDDLVGGGAQHHDLVAIDDERDVTAAAEHQLGRKSAQGDGVDETGRGGVDHMDDATEFGVPAGHEDLTAARRNGDVPDRPAQGGRALHGAAAVSMIARASRRPEVVTAANT